MLDKSDFISFDESQALVRRLDTLAGLSLWRGHGKGHPNNFFALDVPDVGIGWTNSADTGSAQTIVATTPLAEHLALKQGGSMDSIVYYFVAKKETALHLRDFVDACEGPLKPEVAKLTQDLTLKMHAKQMLQNHAHLALDVDAYWQSVPEPERYRRGPARDTLAERLHEFMAPFNPEIREHETTADFLARLAGQEKSQGEEADRSRMILDRLAADIPTLTTAIAQSRNAAMENSTPNFREKHAKRDPLTPDGKGLGRAE